MGNYQEMGKPIEQKPFKWTETCEISDKEEEKKKKIWTKRITMKIN